jgi:neutral ceramidase
MMRSVLVVLVLLGAGPQEEKVFRAGAATCNITPPLGEPIVGGWNSPPAKSIHDELHARCLALDDGTSKLVFVICDNVGIPRDVFDEARRLASEETGLAPERFLFSATHTHSATSARGAKALEQTYTKFLVRRIADGARRALGNLEPARIGWGSVQAPEHVFNRRYFLKEGVKITSPFGEEDKVLMNPGSNPNVVRPAGPVDPEVAFLLVRARKDDRPLALLADYSLHYVGGVPEGEVSADYFAVFAEHLRDLFKAEKADPPFVGILANGTSGDVNNVDVLGPKTERLPPYEKMRRVGRSVAEKVFEAAGGVKVRDHVALDARMKELVLRTRKPDADRIARSKEILARPKDTKPVHAREVTYAERALALAEAPDTVSVPIQAFRLGDWAVAAIPFEVFTDIGLEIKKTTPFERTFTISLANGSYGYLPTPEHHALGGYETWMGTNRVEIEASRKIVATVQALLKELKN